MNEKKENLNTEVEKLSNSINEKKMNEDHLSHQDIVLHLKSASGFDEIDCQIILRAFVDETFKVLKRISLLLEQTEKGELELLLHKLKGSSGNVRATSMMEMAISAEKLCKEGNTDEIKHILLKMHEIIEIMDQFLPKDF
jgi:HPt (histidine-containing phosphotransfer) domain-containing protein